MQERNLFANRVVFPGFQAEGPLPRCAEAHIVCNILCDPSFAIYPLKSRSGHDERIALSLIEFLQARIDIAPNRHDSQILARIKELSLPAQAPRANSCTSTKLAELSRLGAHQNITGILSLRNHRHGQPCG